MSKPIKLHEVFSDWITSGIFTALNDYDVPWKNDNITDLDIEYFGNISGDKTISPLVRKLLDVDGSETLSNDRIAQLANIIYGLNSVNWQKEYNTLTFDYNPISNYDMIETESVSGETSSETTSTGTVGNVVTNTGTVGNTRTETGESSASGKTENDIYGFNSTTNAVNDTANENTSSATAETTTTETRTDNLSENSTRTDNLKNVGTGESSTVRNLTRSGNIGVTTSQQMIESERHLYLWNFFYKIVFPSIDKVLTIATYSH